MQTPTGPHVKNMLTTLIFSVALAGCGGSGGSGNVAPLATGAFIKTVEGNGDSEFFLFGTMANQARSMFLLPAGDISASGELSALRLQLHVDVDEEFTCSGVTVRVGHTSVDGLDTTFDANIGGKGALVTVIDSAMLTIPAGNAGDFFEIPFADTAYYNGVDNLLIDINRLQTCSNAADLRVQSSVGYIGVVTAGAADAVAGVGSEARLSATLVFSGGDNRVLAEDRAGNNSRAIAPASAGRSQFLILANDIDGAGPITGIQFPLATELTEPLSGTYTVTLAHVPQGTTVFTESAFAENIVDAPTVVASDVAFTVPAGASQFWLPLTKSFDYDGTRHLLIDVKARDVSGGVSLRYQNVSGNRVLAIQGDPNAETGFIYARGLEPQLRFHGATIDRVSVGGVGDPWLFPITAAGLSSQVLYLSSDLGTGGTITKLACRMNTLASTETEYTNFQVVMSHTDATALVEEMAANLSDPLVVYEGSYTVPAGLVQGDWVEIPLSTGFAYDGVRNLVIQTRSDAAVKGHACIAKEDVTRYANHYGGGITRDTPNVGLMNFQRDLRFWISK